MLGAVIEAIGIGVLAWAMWEERDGLVYGMMALTGVGVGVRFMPSELVETPGVIYTTSNVEIGSPSTRHGVLPTSDLGCGQSE